MSFDFLGAKPLPAAPSTFRAGIPLVTALLLAAGTISYPYQAKAESKGHAPRVIPIADNSEASTTAAPLKGEVEKIDLTLEELQEMGLDLKRLREAADDLYDEVSRQPINYSMAPNVIGATVINIPVNINVPAMPPRKKWIDASMAEMSPIIKLMKQDVDEVERGETEIKLPEGTEEQIKPLFDDWTKIVKTLDSQLTALEPLTSGPNYVNNRIAALAGAIHDDTKKLDNTRKKIYRILQKEAKSANSKSKRKVSK